MKKYALLILPMLICWALSLYCAVVFHGHDRVQGLPVYLATMLVTLVVPLVIFRHWRITREPYAGEKIKMYCLCSKEALDKMKGIRGKMITQGGHAYLHAFWDAADRFPDMALAYRNTSHAYKITLVVPTEADLVRFKEAYEDVCGVSLVKDAGFTVFKNADGSPCPTITYLGLGPIPESLIGEDIAALKTLT